jgi:ElaB/YqjD/DUF883 family membrane-anchored ribosome-binding protein
MTNRSPDEIRNDIEHTREELGDTVEALAAKTDDVKQQAKSKLDEAKQRVEAAVGHGSGSTDPALANGAPGAAAPSASTNDIAEKARAGAQRAQQTAAENPVPAAALGGFVGGLIVGRLMCRRH